jgi:hypothetical protein
VIPKEIVIMTTKPRLIPLALAGLLALPLAAAAQAQASDEHGAHHPEAGQAAAPAGTASIQDLRQAMRARMAEIRATQDPERRRQLLEAQMRDMEAMLEAGACPQPGGGMMGGRGGPGMMGGGMQHGMGGPGMHGGMGSQGPQGDMGCGMQGRGMHHGMGGQGKAAADVATRLEALEKRVDLIQIMLQMQARQACP